MKYACLVYHDASSLDVPQEELRERMRACGEWVESLEGAGQQVFCAALQESSTATTLRSRDGKIAVTDGPFAETKEFLAGLTVLEARDLNEALREASKLAACSLATIEVRAILEPGAAVATALDRKILAAIGES
ncbi:MAG: YciI family protein [Usitatibacter sp.]